MFTKPNTKSITGAAMTAGALVVGAKVGDGVSALMPESTAAYKRWVIAGIALVGAASIPPKTAVAQAGQNALIGMGVKQLYDELSETLAAAIPVKAGDTTTNRFVNAVVGHKDIALIPALGASWQGNDSAMWDRPEEMNLIGNSFTGV